MRQKSFNIFNTKTIKFKKGNILKTFNSTNLKFSKMKEIYFSWVNNKSVKAWKLHKKMTIHLVVPFGKVKFVILNKKDNKFKEIILGEKNYKILKIKPNTWFGFKSLSKTKSLIMNCSTLKHSKNEILRKNINQMKYKW